MNYAIIFAGAVFPVTAHAYLDPGTGSIILQGLIAAVAAGLVVIKTYWYKIKTFFGKKDAKSLADEEGAGDELDSDFKN